MRSKNMSARALFRLLTSQSAAASASQASSAAATASAAASSSAAATSSGSTSQQHRQHRQQSQHASTSRSFRRKQQLLANGTGSLSRGRRSSGMPSRLRPDSEAAQVMNRIKDMLYSAQQSSQTGSAQRDATASGSFHNSLMIPPPTSLGSVATQAFFAHDRPLLEYMVVTGDADIPSSISRQILSMGESAHQEEDGATQSSAERDEIAQVKHLLMSAHSAISEVVSQAKNMSQEELSHTTFVISATDEGMSEAQTLEDWQKQLEEGTIKHEAPQSWTKRVEKLDHARFSSIIDQLAEPTTPAKDIISAEVNQIREEEERQREIQSAVDDALEYGEDPTAARALGREADLVILGEPKGAPATWARGVATHMAINLRAYEEPPAPVPQDERDIQLQNMFMSEPDGPLPVMSRRYNGVIMNTSSEDDPNLLLSHAMVQARLPASLQWDRVVAQMAAATLRDEASTSTTPLVDVSKLNADLLPPKSTEDAGENIIQVNLDSVKRKRRKKMRKHKYKKLRKATRTERSRLKKQ